ncbi:MAG: ABC transporter permease [Candidatus Hadarchaeum sp.]|uniref:ABC transporter permease n=1 Tax=Candidatus Hadarchaeum sp. TaxID=2883567 RepID=UPI0031718447
MWKYLLRRVLMVPITVWIIISLVFVIMRIVPGDPALLIAGPFATPDQVEQLRVIFGLNEPLHKQYAHWITGIVFGDWGKSFQTRSPVLPLLAERLPRTLQLTLVGLALAMLFGIPLGVLAAAKANSFVDYSASALAVLWFSMPIFWFALVLQLIFSIKLGWFPISGSGYGMWSLDNLRHLTLPVVSLGLTFAAQFFRFTRSSVLEILYQDYIRTAWSKGLPLRHVLFRHTLRNAMVPIITLVGLRVPWVVGGAVILENIFAWPGMGSFVVQAIYNRDYHVVEGFMIILACLVVIVNLIVDWLYVLVNPTIRYE